MRVLLLLDWYLYYTVQLANGLCWEHDVLLVTRDHNYEISSPQAPQNLDRFLDEYLDRRIRREKLRYRQSDSKNLFEVARIFKKVREFGPDVVHVQENTDWRILLLAVLVGLRKTILTIHDVVIHPGDPSGILKPIRRILRRRAQKIIVHGDFLKRALISLINCPEHRICVVPHGAFTLYRKWDDGSVQEERTTILFFGRISQYKGIDVLIQAEPRITREIPGTKIIIAGKGPDFDKYADLIQDRSHFELYNRFIPDAEVAALFRRASIVVLPYREASQSGVVQVAYAFGKPVVVTDVGSLPEVVDNGKTGYVISPGDPEALAKAVIRILGDRALLKSMGQQALIKAETDLSWGGIAQKTARIYSEVLSHAR